MADSRITIEECDLDENLARTLLGVNTGNRPIKKSAIKKYADDIENGRWRFTAEPVKISDDGTLLDGQNRCHAVLLACERSGLSLSIPILLIKGLPKEAQDVMDSGAGRNLGDQLAIRGVTSYSAAAAMVRAIVMFKSGSTSDWLKTQPTKAKMLEFYDAQPGALDAALHCCPQYGNTSGVHESVQAAARFLIGEVCDDTDAIEKFFHGLRVGADLSEGDAILALRTRTMYMKRDRETVTNIALLILTIRAWNFWRRGEPVGRLQIRPKGKVPTVDKIET